ncbi:MAG: fused MFS/spermidine synthase [Myxococcota bacterium]|nr:fused MFS/spermidine synthase [Myxococcota bacterium]MDW8362443.1 fused MFS/spermidine synthase [Myxococcales bacterium]
MHRLLPYAAFVLSGASSLVFQALWSRMLHHVFGATSVAISTVLTCFMAGLGLGAWLAGRWADRIRHPIITYAIAELVVAAWALLLPWLVDPTGWLADVNAALRASLPTDSPLFIAARFACVAPLLLVPTTLMGTTLPLLARHFVQHADDPARVGVRVGTLYAVNTAGAVLGTFLAGFVLMPTIGLRASNLAAVGLNVLLAALIFAFRKPLLGATWTPGSRLRFWPERATTTGATEPTEARPERNSAPSRRPDAEPAEAHAREEAAASPIVPFARRAALIAFAGSGAAALAYEVVWSRALAMTIGSSIQSFSLILVTFLVGIAGGSALASGLVRRGPHRPVVVGAFSVVLAALAGAPWGVAYGTAAWLGATALATLPIALTVVVAVGSARGRPPELVPEGTRAGLLALAVPLLVAAIGAAVVRDQGALPLVVLGVCASACALAVVLLALRRHPVLQLGLVQLVVAAATVVNYIFQDDLPYVFARLVAGLGERLPDHVGTVRFFMFLTAGLCILPATLGMGAMFPLTVRLWTSGGARVARDVGTVYTANTLGSIVGAWLPGFVLFAAIGMERTLLVGIWLNLALALLMLVAASAEPEGAATAAPTTRTAARPPAAPRWHTATIYVLSPTLPIAAALLYLGAWHEDGALRWNRAHMTLGVFRVSLAADVLDPESWGEPEIEYYHDGLSTTVSVERWGRHVALKNNGKVDASNGDDMPTQIMVAMFPLLMHGGGDGPLDVAVIGFGSGVTVGSALQFPPERVRRVDAVELEPAVVEASRFFEDVNHLDYPLDRFPWVRVPRLEVIADDGRNFLASTDRRYDIVMSEPSNPWITGVSDLFTADHFAIAKRVLRPGGIYCQWVQLYELSPENIKSIYRTFASQFRHVVVFAAEDLSSDTILLGSDAPLPLDVARIRRAFEVPSVAAELERAYVHSPFDVLARVLLASRDEVMSYARIEYRSSGGRWVAHPDTSNGPDEPCEPPVCRREPAPLNTDDNARIEFAAPDDLIGFQRYEGYLANIYSPDWPYGRLMRHLRGMGQGDEAARNHAELALSLIGHGRKLEASEHVRRAHELGTAREVAVAAEVLRLLLSDEHEPVVPIEPPVPGPQLDAESARRLVEGFQAVRAAVDARAWATALSAMEEIPDPLRRQSGPGMRLLHGYLLYRGAETSPSNYRAAIDELEELLRAEPDYARRHPEIHYLLARAHDAELNFDKALRNMRAYVEARLVTAERDEGHPERDGAPSTDAPGHAPTELHPDRARALPRPPAGA